MLAACFLARRQPRAIASRALLARSLSTPTTAPVRVEPSKKALEIIEHDRELVENDERIESEKSVITRYREASSRDDPHNVYAVSEPLPPVDLPEIKSEVAALDQAHKNTIPRNLDGSEKWVTIKQEQSKWPCQSPLGKESAWVISFQDQGETAETWENPLMGWVSSADPMANNMRLQMSFETAQEAKYFADKRGWKYEIEMPITRMGRDDDAQYQDCFLPQAVAGKVKREGHKCDHWHRPAAGTSHYFRPLKFHGDGTVRQHGPNREQATEKAPEGYYKMR